MCCVLCVRSAAVSVADGTWRGLRLARTRREQQQLALCDINRQIEVSRRAQESLETQFAST